VRSWLLGGLLHSHHKLFEIALPKKPISVQRMPVSSDFAQPTPISDRGLRDSKQAGRFLYANVIP
jgi:hypothetical protein